jgi:DNA-binding GntR family transcriptional regulator
MSTRPTVAPQAMPRLTPAAGDSDPVPEDAPRVGLDGIARENLTDVVFARLRQAIVDRRIAPGERVTESSLAEQLDVSKTPVREALLRLRQIGLIEDYGRRGGRVVRPSRSSLLQTYEVREALETFAAVASAERADKEARARILDAARRSAAGATTGDLDAFHHWDVVFHEAVTTAADSARIAELTDDVVLLIVTLRTRDLPYGKTSIACGREHVKIAQAIAGGRAEHAGELMRVHIRHVRDFVLDSLFPGDDTSGA